MSQFQKTFKGEKPFEAMNACTTWLEERGYSYGSTCAMHPTGVLRGDFAIAKWKNLTTTEIAELDGRITGNTREGPVTVVLKAPPADLSE